MFSSLIDKIDKNPRILFLIDGLGATVSALSYCLVLGKFVELFGMPIKALNVLCLMAIIYAVFSITTYIRKVDNWRLYLKIIAIANLLHCLLTVAFLFNFKSSIQGLGLLYFICEILIIGSLAIFEWWTALNHENSNQ
jgi:hypothetical protein